MVFSKGEFFVKTFIPVTYWGRNRWNSIFAQLLRMMNIFSVNTEWVQRCDKTVWRLKYNLTCRINTTFSWFVGLPHSFLTHSRAPACKNLVLDLYCYRCSLIIISTLFKAWIQSHWKHLICFKKKIICLKNIDLQVFSILTDSVWF